ncbi:Shedu anti-phage system protein SduA domain-containing protein [Stenotrophomonas sp. NPDC077461]|uniref:Shedu anti-phage system protein SduA domain-containing protein n=1 Tax=Stenotrophomonas sp. NPDC077461 TaxID=3414698 RepID=UPI003C2E5EA5
MQDANKVHRIVRKAASSGKLDYAPPVVLNETTKSKLQALAWFIPHSDRTEFSLKLEGFVKSKNQPWVEDKAKTLTLTEASSLQLLKYLQTHLPVAAQSGTGEFILIKVSNGEANLSEHDPEELVGALTKVLSQPELVQHLSTAELTHELSAALRGSIRLSEMRSAVAELRSNLGREVGEQVYQAWCEKHCWAFGNAYVMRDEVRNISSGDSLDLLLPNVIAGYRDIVELKRPDKDVLVYDSAHRNYYFSADVSKAIGQCHRYLDILHEHAKHGLLDHKEVVAYHPRATIVIGRSHDWSDVQQRSLHGLNRRLHGISVMTYDHLLAQGERLLEMMSPSVPYLVNPSSDEDDDIPW